jgi:hypothetical protein
MTILIPHYDLLDGLEFDLQIPFGFAEQELDFGIARSRREDLGLADIAGRLRYQLLYEGRVRPDLDPMICTPRKSESLMIWTTLVPKLTPFGTSGCNANHINAGAGGQVPHRGDTLLGTGHWQVGGGVALVKTLDPVVFFGRLGYSATLERQGRDPGDQLFYVLGMGYSLNDRVSFNMRVGGAALGRTAVDGQEIPGFSLEVLSLQFGVTTRVAWDVFVELIVSVGLTEEAAAAVAGVSLVYQFRRRR